MCSTVLVRQLRPDGTVTVPRKFAAALPTLPAAVQCGPSPHLKGEEGQCPVDYRFLITDLHPNLVACSYVPSVASPGMTICYNEDGTAVVVEPVSAGGKIRPTRPDENPDSPWCWGELKGDLLVYRTSPDDEPDHIIAFRVIK